MKIIYRYLFKKFLGPFALTFFFAVFILLMQFLWKYVDDLVGKGLELSVILELLFYASATCVNLATPLAVLLSSLMTFGSLGEHYEIIAIKSAGISIFKLIFSLSLLAILIAFGSFWFADNVTPKAYDKMRTLLRSIMDQKPTLSIEEGVFYDGFDNYTIRVGKKNRNNKDIYDILLFNHEKYQGNTTFTYAQRGKMEMTDDKLFMLFYLYDGFYWDENPNVNSSSKNQLVRTKFSEQYKRFDISSFKFEKSDENFYSKNNQALSNAELRKMSDTVRNQVSNHNAEIVESFLSSCYGFKFFFYPNDLNPTQIDLTNIHYNDLNNHEKSRVLDRVGMLKNDFTNTLKSNGEYKKHLNSLINSYRAEWYKKYVISVACILMFFIGAPLGSIIRKGGIGTPLVITVVFFSSYFMLSIFGEKIAKGGAVPVWTGMWLSSFVLFPICAFLNYQASVDSALLSSEELHKTFIKIIPKNLFAKRKNENPSTYP